MNQEWFEMPDVRRRKLNKAVWIPLRAAQILESEGKCGYLDYRQEFFGAGSVAVPLDKKTSAETLGWMDVGLAHSHCGGIEEGRYVPADVFHGYGLGLNAVALALEQRGNADDSPEWHLHQDLAITLKLKREGDLWLAMEEGYLEVARLKRDAGGRPKLLEIRAEQLKDYLCARDMALYITSYRNREEILADANHISWAEDSIKQVSGGDRWEGRRVEICEGGQPFGSSAAVMFIGRKDVDTLEEVPAIGPSDENIVSTSWTKKFEGQKLVRIQGELWRNEWVDPTDHSPRVRGDKPPPSVFFITDANGTLRSADSLEGSGGWLWFRPEVIMAVLQRRGGGLRLYTRHTGGVKSSPGSYLHFGVNALGLVSVFAKDIGYLAEWEQKIWAGFNVGPEGGVSEELLAAQAEGRPAETQAPEVFLPRAVVLLNEVTTAKFGFALFREHEDLEDLAAGTHRFRASDQKSLFSLAKDVARLTADSIDTGAIQKIVQPPKTEEWGSLKSLEKLVGLSVGPEKARSLLGPLVGIYELRHADAHLAGSNIDDSFALARVDRTQPFVFQGYRLLDSCVSSLYSILTALHESPTKAD
jgi:hypothetical protein